MIDRLRNAVFAIACGLFFFLCFQAGRIEALTTHSRPLMLLFGAMAMASVLAWAFFPNTRNLKSAVFLILGLSVLSRLLLYPFPYSDDVNRYLWEGKLVLHGENPYQFTAEAKEWEALRDPYWEAMNHKDRKTAYPPLIILSFAALNSVAYHPATYKVLSGLADMAVIGLLLLCLTRRGMHPKNALFYALNPVPLLAFSGEGHFDVLFVLATLAALLLWEDGKTAWSWVMLGISIQVKIVSVLLIPLLFWNKKSCKALWIGLPLLAPSLVFWPQLHHLLHGLLQYGGTMSHNGSVNYVLLSWLGDRLAAAGLSTAILLIAVAAISLRTKDVLKGGYAILAALVLFSPTVHYWYLAWIVPGIALFPSAAWILLTGLSGLYFSAWDHFGRTGIWWQPKVCFYLQWIPFYLCWAPSFLARLWQLRARPVERNAATLSVVIPCLDEGEQLRNCLAGLADCSYPIEEILVVDGGSTDDSRTIAQKYQAKWLTSRRGRGRQIAAAVEACTGDIVLVLHADSRVTGDLIGRVMASMENNPDAVGGAVGQRFRAGRKKPVLLLVEGLNDLRAQLLHSSFGDQGQFFRREEVNRGGGFPAIPLMEDVELTAQLRKRGDLLFLGGGMLSSPRRWEKENALKRIAQVISLVIRYKTSRLFGRSNARKLYGEYYPDPD